MVFTVEVPVHPVRAILAEKLKQRFSYLWPVWSQDKLHRRSLLPVSWNDTIMTERLLSPSPNFHCFALLSALAFAVSCNALGASSFGIYSSTNCRHSASEKYSSANSAATCFFVRTWHVW